MVAPPLNSGAVHVTIMEDSNLSVTGADGLSGI
jgi:hypothetical protein